MSYEATSGGSTSRRTITAFFDDRSEADAAIARLVEAGISRDNIRLMPGASGSGAGTTASTTGTSSHGGTSSVGASSTYGSSTSSTGEPGFWDSLKDLFLPDEDRHVYAEGLRRGGYLVTVTTTETNYERVLDILEREGTIDVGQRETEWRSQGWKGYTGEDYTSSSRGGVGLTGAAAAAAMGGTTATRGTAGTTARTSAQTTGTATGTTGNTEAIPIVEEELRVGKREVDHGRVRVRSYVVETPIQEQVSLREEHVNVERRPVDRPVTDADRLFQDRTIEVAQKAEEAVISKEARVKEELVVNKQVEERTQTVSDTVRRTEVEVEDERGNRVGGTGTTGTTSGTGTTRRTP